MINHVTLFVSNLNRSREFFAKALRPLGYRMLIDGEKSVGFGIEDAEGKRNFWIKRGTALPGHSLSCLAFSANSKEVVNDFYEAAMKAGGKDNGKPEYCTNYHPGYYAAFVFDPDGNNIEAVFDDFSKVKH